MADAERREAREARGDDESWRAFLVRMAQEQAAVRERAIFQSQIDALKDRLDVRHDELEKRLEMRFAEAQRAVELAATALDKRLEGMNEIRSQLGTQRAEFATNEKLDNLDRSMRGQIEQLGKQIVISGEAIQGTNRRDLAELRARMDRDEQAIAADIRSLRESRSQSAGAGASVRELAGYAFGFLTLVLSALYILVSTHHP